jgi:hypothetical protein
MGKRFQRGGVVGWWAGVVESGIPLYAFRFPSPTVLVVVRFLLIASADVGIATW